MATVICGNSNCTNRKGEFCGLDFVSLNGIGQCLVYFSKTGSPLSFPDWGRNRIKTYKPENISLAEEEKVES